MPVQDFLRETRVSPVLVRQTFPAAGRVSHMATPPGCTIPPPGGHTRRQLEAQRRGASQAPARTRASTRRQPPPTRPGSRAAPMSRKAGQPGPGRAPAPPPRGAGVRLDTAPGRSQARRPACTRLACAGSDRGSPCGRSQRGGVRKSGRRRRAEGVLRVALSIGRLHQPAAGLPCWCVRRRA